MLQLNRPSRIVSVKSLHQSNTNELSQSKNCKRIVSNELSQSKNCNRIVSNELSQTNCLNRNVSNELSQTNCFNRIVSNKLFRSNCLNRISQCSAALPYLRPHCGVIYFRNISPVSMNCTLNNYLDKNILECYEYTIYRIKRIKITFPNQIKKVIHKNVTFFWKIKLLYYSVFY